VKCWSCGRQSAHLIERGGGLAVCEACVLRLHVEAGSDFAGACAFCGQQMGVRRGWLRRRPALRVGLRRGEEAMCDECLRGLRDAVAQQTDEG